MPVKFRQNTQFVANENIVRNSIIVDATEQSMGKLASGVAYRLMGKHRSDYSPHQNIGDFVIVTNLVKVKFTGNKLNSVYYYDHTLYPGGLKTSTLRQKFEKSPSKLFIRMVKGMLPKGVLGRQILKNLRAYDTHEHQHQSQMPKAVAVVNLK